MQPTTITQVIQRLDQIIEDSKQEESTLGYFAALYRKVTIKVKEKLGTGYFDSDDRMEHLDVIFANRYLAAYADYKEGKSVTKSWELAFRASEEDKLIVFQHLILGMNAHINLDLGIAAAQISDETNIEFLRGDFQKINEVLSELVEGVEKDLSEIWPKLAWFLKVFKKADSFLIDFSMTVARDGAWLFANELVSLRDAHSLPVLISERDLKIEKLGKNISHPGRVERFVFWIIRISEKGSPSQKIAVLED